MLKTVLTTIAILIFGTGIAAQQAQPAAPPAQSPATTPNPSPRTPGQFVNVKLELTITDQRGGSAATPKTVTMVIADRGSARIRTSGGGGITRHHLNVDASAELVEDKRVHTSVTLEYQAAPEGDRPLPGLTESVSTILEDGKPLVVTQSADPASDRKVRVELKATVLK